MPDERLDWECCWEIDDPTKMLLLTAQTVASLQTCIQSSWLQDWNWNIIIHLPSWWTISLNNDTIIEKSVSWESTTLQLTWLTWLTLTIPWWRSTKAYFSIAFYVWWLILEILRNQAIINDRKFTAAHLNNPN